MARRSGTPLESQQVLFSRVFGGKNEFYRGLGEATWEQLWLRALGSPYKASRCYFLGSGEPADAESGGWDKHRLAMTGVSRKCRLI